MTKRLLFTSYLPIPVFLKLEIEEDMITLTSYEELAENESSNDGAVRKLGRVTGLPAGGKAPRYNQQGLKSVLDEVSDSMIAPEPWKIDGRSVVRIADLHRESLSGDEVDPSLCGRDFVRLSSAALSRRDLQLRGEWKDMSVWIFEIDQDGRLQVPHNTGVLLQGLGSTSARLSMVLNRINALTVYQPFAKAPFTECSFYMKANRYYGFSAPARTSWTQVSWEEMSRMIGCLMPQLRLVSLTSMVAASEPTVLEIEAFDPTTGETITEFPMTVGLTAISGYVPKTMIELKNGRASFKVMGLGLAAGETVRLKAGLGHFDQLLDIQLTVSEGAQKRTSYAQRPTSTQNSDVSRNKR